MEFTELTLDDVHTLLLGCTVYGTGGGGDFDEGWDYILRAHNQGKTFRLVSIDDLPEDYLLCTPYLLGALDAQATLNSEEYKQLPRVSEIPMLNTLRKSEAFVGQKIQGALCCELGGSNTAIALYIAAMCDGFIVDADPAGRAVPEITHSTYYLNDLPAAPAIASNVFGESFICENIVDDIRAESVIRALSKVSNNDLSVIDHILPVSAMKNGVIKGTLSKAIVAGNALQNAKSNQQDIADALAEACNGKVLFRGIVTDYKFETRDGFTLGNIQINSEISGQSCDIQIKNENMLAKLDGVVTVTIPDLITVINLDDGNVVTNPNVIKNANVAVLILPAPEAFTSAKGLKIFGPEYLGLAMQYNPYIT